MRWVEWLVQSVDCVEVDCSTHAEIGLVVVGGGGRSWMSFVPFGVVQVVLC